jgi:hypothetical protein
VGQLSLTLEKRSSGRGRQAGQAGPVTRTAIVPVRLTAGERDQLSETARDMGLSLSTYMRQVVLGRPLPPRRAIRHIPEVNSETYNALGALSATLRELARRMAERSRNPGVGEVLRALELLARLVGKVRAEVLGAGEGGEG